MTQHIDWSDNAGNTYRYWFLATPSDGSTIKAEAGNYVFVKRLPNGNYTPVYFGVAENLRNRLPCHDRWDDAVRAGATNVMAHTTPAGEAARLSEERALIQKWNPPLNTHHRQVS